MSHLMNVYANTLRWECVSHGHSGRLADETVKLRPFMSPAEVFAEVEGKARAACERKKPS